jgi:creatinine amidohydrolase
MRIDQPISRLQAQNRRIVLLPIGSCEQHGPHLPIDTDLRIAQLIADELVEAFPYKKAILLPAIPFSCSWEHKGLGTIALNTNTVSHLLHDIALSLKNWKTPILLVLINWHGGNSALASIATEITATEYIPTTVMQTITLAREIWDSENKPPSSDVHAGALETSIIQAYWPGLATSFDKRDFTPDIEPATVQSVFQSLGVHTLSKTGIWGNLQHTNPERGKAVIKSVVKETYRQITKLLELIENADHNEKEN